MNGIPGGLVDLLKARPRLAVLTGAGMSAESGVPVFRGPGGLWEGNRPEDLATPEAFARDPAKVWRWYRWRLERVLAAEPHAGHRALVRLGREVEEFTLVTQNVDGLHQRAGSRDVIELHGNLTRARCTACGLRLNASRVDPDRPECGCGRGLLRPDVVWFGEALDPATAAAAWRAVERAEMVWVVGTSSVVFPAAALPRMAAERGLPVVEVNPEPTPLSGGMPFSFRTSASEGLAALAGALLGNAPL